MSARPPLFALLVLALVVVGCGGGTTTVTQTVTETVTQTGTTGGAGGEKCPAFDFNIKIVSVSGMSCEDAAAVLEQVKSVSKSFEVAGFSCNLVEGQRLSGIWECVSGPKSFRFAFGD
jgi:hypothetical protein